MTIEWTQPASNKEEKLPLIIMAAAPTVCGLKEGLFTKSFSGRLTADLVTRASHIAENSTESRIHIPFIQQKNF